MDQRWLLSRRALLGGIGALGATALLPRSLSSRSLVRAAGEAPKRLMVCHVPEGMWQGAQRPAVGASTLGPIFGALDPFKSKIIALDGLNMKSRDNGPGGDGHHRGVVHMFTGIEMKDENNAGGASVDQQIAAAIGGDTLLPSLQLAVRIVYNDTNSKPIWSGPARAVPAVQDPWQAYKRIFPGAATSSAPSSGGSSTPAPAKFDLRKSAIDSALVECGTLRARLSASDRDRLDSYQESLRDIERRLTMVASSPGMTAAAGGCSQPDLGASINVSAEANYPKIAQLQMDLAVAAFQCDVTRVASLQFGNSNDQCSYSWLGVNNLGHDISHNNNNCDPDNAKKLKVYNWYSQQFAYLLGKLDAIPEGSGTLLDNTAIVWASEFSDSSSHAGDNLTWLLMGGAGGYFKTGQVLNVTGRSTNDFCTSLQNAFGIADAKFGNPAYCQGALPGLV
jgi:hypothetical protein